MRRFRRVCAVAPTGFGKTICFVLLAKIVFARGKRVVIVAHRIEIVNQISKALTRANILHDIMAPGRRQFARTVVVAMVQTLCRRTAEVKKPDILIVDEAHHATAGSYRKLTDAWPGIFVLGVTATPTRTSGQGLRECFDTIVLGPPMRELIARGRLADFVYLAPPPKVDLSGIQTRAGDYAQDQLAAAMDKAVITGDAVKYYAAKLAGRPAIAFCVSVEHAKHVAQQFVSAGWKAASVDGATDPDVRADLIAAIGDGRLNVLTSCDIISEGTDIPVVSGALLLRPTQSLIIFLQQCGRVLRPKPDLSKAVILDHVGSVFRFGLPDEPREWTLEGSKNRKQVAPAIRQCPQCFRAHRPSPSCPSCGFVYPPNPAARGVEVVDGDLAEISAAEIERVRTAPLAVLIRQARTYGELDQIRRIRKYKPGWTKHVMDAKIQKASREAPR